MHYLDHWRQHGFGRWTVEAPAIEAARAARNFGFAALGLDEIVAFTVPSNTRSRDVMIRLGMKHAVDEDFDHPRIAEGDPLRRHVLYRLVRSQVPPE